MTDLNTRLSSSVVVAAGVFGLFYFLIAKHKLYLGLRNVFKSMPMKNQQIVVCNSVEQCDWALIELQRRCADYRVLGFDCEWVTEKKRRKPIALLQLAAPDGFTVLFRLSTIKIVPNGLKELLENSTIYKVGVAPIDDAKYLYQDYGVLMHSTIDLRQIVHSCGEKPGGLAYLAGHYLGITMEKSWRVRCGDWEADTLSERQIKYAADDAHVAVLLFSKLIYKKIRTNLPLWARCFTRVSWNDIDWLCKYYADVSFKSKSTDDSMVKNSLLGKQQRSVEKIIKKRYPFSTRSKPLYDNCFMEAPDGELLCTCDSKKAQWYVDKGIADFVKQNPTTVRLKFEPAGRAVGGCGQFYKLSKENRCVVCGVEESFIKKNVVPREYRKYFPDVMKDHSSHDVVLLCVACHQRSNMSDLHLRNQLAIECKAPLSDRENSKTHEDFEIRRVMSAGKALLYQNHSIPLARKLELEGVVKKYFGTDALTPAHLCEASRLCPSKANDNFTAHGQRVVEVYSKRPGGLLELEEMWRSHFLQAMRPAFLPKLWSVSHNRERLQIHADEGRLDKKYYSILGLKRP